MTNTPKRELAKSELGNTYGRLSVVSRIPSVGGKAAWLCQCSCGNTHQTTGDSLRTGRVKSCGCYRSEGEHNVSHGHGSYRRGISRTYRSWQDMKSRCDNPKDVSYKNYGGRGITYTSEWVRFETFLEDMGERPPETSLDRLDGALPYSKANCAWSSREVQNNNKRNVKLITYAGKTQGLAQWCRELQLNYPRMYNRLYAQGKSFADALSTTKYQPGRK